MKHFSQSFTILMLVCFLSQAAGQITTPIPGIAADSDYMVYYSDFDNTIIQQAQYLDMIILDIGGLDPADVADIRNGFDNISGTGDDVLIIGYISIGEAHLGNIQGDGSGPCYWNGSQVVYENFGVASFYLDDRDYNGIPDQNYTWNSYYVNAGDPNWWAYNASYVDEILITYGCDGIFMDTVETAAPASWGMFYEWTTEGMTNYIAHLRSEYPEKLMIMNRGFFYFHPSLAANEYVDVIRSSINGVMFEGYYLQWDWNSSSGEISPYFPNNEMEWAPLLNAQAQMQDGFTVISLDYLNPDQPNYQTLLAAQVNETEGEQGWTNCISTVLLDEIRWDTYHFHLADNNPPTWEDGIGILAYERLESELTVYWNSALDQTPPIRYHLYISEGDIDFSQAADIVLDNPEPSASFDFQLTLSDLGDTEYQIAMRASDSAAESHLDPNRVIISVPADSSSYGTTTIDGWFQDWSGVPALNNDELTEGAGDGLFPAADIVDVWMQEDLLKYYVSFTTAGPMDAGFFYHIFLDTDMNPATGYHSSGSYAGIDLMVENGNLWLYTGTGGEWSWSYEGVIAWMTGAENTSRVELALEKSLFPTGQESVMLVVNINELNDSVPDDFAPDQYETAGFVFPVPAEECLPGDINVDTALDVLDVVLLVGHILGQTELSGCGLISADVNQDSAVDVLDVVLLVDWILNGQEIINN